MNPLALTPAGFAWMALAVLVAGFVRGYSGFGFSALTIASASLVMNPLHFVAVVVIWETVMSLQAWRHTGRHVDWRRVGALLAGAVLALPLGIWALHAVSESVARAVISLYVLGMCAILLAGWRMKAEAGMGATLATGVISGLANATGMGGLPVAAFFAAQPLAPAVFRATLVAYFPMLDLYSAPFFGMAGMLNWASVAASVIGLPLVLVANWAGSRHFLATDPRDFRRFAIALLAGLALLGLGKAVL